MSNNVEVAIREDNITNLYYSFYVDLENYNPKLITQLGRRQVLIYIPMKCLSHHKDRQRG